MNYTTIANAAVQWAISKIGCEYSQARRTEPQVFDCSSLVARAYSAQGKKWLYGGAVPTSNLEVYDDDFELIWPREYRDIGSTFGDSTEIRMCDSPGSLQFLCTDMDTSRKNKITHVAMVSVNDQIVHARGKNYGVCTNDIDHYAGKVCAVSRYNPTCTLRLGMKGYRTLALQKALDQAEFHLELDGEYGTATAEAVKQYQTLYGLAVTGQADITLLSMLGLSVRTNECENDEKPSMIRITGGSVNIRKGPGTEYDIFKTTKRGEEFRMIDIANWFPVSIDNEIYWISKKYAEIK